MPCLYIVATPIGNLEDITLRALRILQEVDLIAAEDTRVTRKLLSHYNIHTRVVSYNDHNKKTKTQAIMHSLKTGDVALVSDAGTPIISDPGLDLLQAAIREGFQTVSVPGPSALITALTVAGMATEPFLFLGFLPRTEGKKLKLLRSIAGIPYTKVLYEAPHRLTRTLRSLEDVLGNQPITAIREATKFYEEIFRGSISDCRTHFIHPKGEFTIVISGYQKRIEWPVEAIQSLLNTLTNKGIPSKEARKTVSTETRIPRREIYRIWLSTKK